MSARRTAPKAHPAYRDELLRHSVRGRHSVARTLALELLERQCREALRAAVARAALTDPAATPAERYLAGIVLERTAWP